MSMKFVGTKIPPEWLDRLDKITKQTALTQGAILREAIGQYLGIENVIPITPVIELRSEIEDLKARVTALEGKTPLSNRYPVDEVRPSEPSTRPTKTREQSTGALTTGELFVALEGKGYARAIGTLRRALKAAIDVGMLPDDLAEMGVTAGFEVRRSANPKDNSVRWLFLDHPS